MYYYYYFFFVSGRKGGESGVRYSNKKQLYNPKLSAKK